MDLKHKIGRIHSSISNPLANLIDYNLEEDFVFNKEDNTYSISKENYEVLLNSLKVIQKTNEDNHSSLKDIIF